MTPAEFAQTPLGKIIAESRRSRKRTIGLRFVLTAHDDPDFREPISGVFSLTVAELQRMVDIFDGIDVPDGFDMEIQAVARKREAV